MVESNAGILVLGDYRQTLTITRSLARAHYRVSVGTVRQPIVHTRYSRSVRERWLGPGNGDSVRPDSSQEFVPALLAFLSQRPDIKWIFPVGETDLRALTPHVEKFAASVGLVMTDAKVIEACMNKVLACQKAQDCNVPQMPYEIVGDRHELDNAVRGIGYPCVVKPVSERFTIGGEKASILRSQDDLDGNFELWPADNARLIVQGFAEGQRHNCHFLADEGRLLAYFEQVVLRTTRANGTGYGTDGLSVPPSPQLRKYCEALLMNLNYSGAGCVQFMVDDRQGTACFLEINPRLDATCALAVRCGYDFPLMALEYARYRRGITFAPPGNDSVYSRCRVVWLLGEIEALGHELRRHHIGARQAWTAFWGTVRSALTADVHLVWSWRDPLPALHAFTRLLAAVVVHRKASD